MLSIDTQEKKKIYFLLPLIHSHAGKWLKGVRAQKASIVQVFEVPSLHIRMYEYVY